MSPVKTSAKVGGLGAHSREVHGHDPKKFGGGMSKGNPTTQAGSQAQYKRIVENRGRTHQPAASGTVARTPPAKKANRNS